MSQSGTKRAESERTLRLKREKNRIAQQKHREKKKNDIKKMMTILQNVKLAATRKDIRRIQELVKSPTILLPVESSPANIPHPSPTFLDMEELFPVADDSSSSSQPLGEVQAGTVAESTAVVRHASPQSCAKVDNFSSLETENFFQLPMDPFYWNMANMLPPFQVPFFDTQSPLQILSPVAMPSPWESYSAIMAGM